ncbi:hypothetical protein M0R45_024675 [Rubus argutus]|uniref:Uncharacterized protein n=1 Tax=Rubus argutus TaxID=59490 RepID=A0AAW1WUW9_RUBAR
MQSLTRVLQNDFCRLKQLSRPYSHTWSPINKFSWGNKKSLDDAREEGSTCVNKFWSCTETITMNLLIYLRQWVLELFGDVKKGPQVNLEFQGRSSCLECW